MSTVINKPILVELFNRYHHFLLFVHHLTFDRFSPILWGLCYCLLLSSGFISSLSNVDVGDRRADSAAAQSERSVCSMMNDVDRGNRGKAAGAGAGN